MALRRIANSSDKNSSSTSSNGSHSFDDCLLLQALNEALSRLTASAFIRREVAGKILATARIELIRRLVERASIYPCICMSGQLQLYRHRANTWLLIIQRVRIAVAKTLNRPASHSSATSARVSMKAASQHAEQMLGELRKMESEDREAKDSDDLKDYSSESTGIEAYKNNVGGDTCIDTNRCSGSSCIQKSLLLSSAFTFVYNSPIRAMVEDRWCLQQLLPGLALPDSRKRKNVEQ